MSAAIDLAEAYDKVSTTQKEDGLRLIKLLSVKKGDKVLDFGCGTGYLTRALSDLVGPEGKVVGVDLDKDRIKVAREKYSADNVEYVEGSFEDIPDTGYDTILCNYVLLWCKNKDAIFKKMSHILKKEGKFGFSTDGYYDVLEVFFNPIEAFSQTVLDSVKNMMHLITQEEYQALAASNSFDITYWKEEPSYLQFDIVDEIVQLFMIHSHGRFDKSNFNMELLKKHYGEGSKKITSPIFMAILIKK